MFPVTNRAQPALEFISPNYSAWLRRLMKPLMPAMTAWKTNLVAVESHNVETLAKLYHEFRQGKTRFLIAFRHPNSTDPYVLSHLLWQDLPQIARQMGLNLGTTHAHFIYDRGIPLWAGSYLSWVFSRLGGVPIQRGKLDLMALKTARTLLADGQFPLAAAPEGGNNGHNEIMSPLEPGISQLAFWCAEDLAVADRSESVVILPVGIQYRYLKSPWLQLGDLLGQLETDSGIGQPSLSEMEALRKLFGGAFAGDGQSAQSIQSSQAGMTVDLIDLAELYGRLYRLAEHLLTLMEGYYREFYGVDFEPLKSSSPESNPLDPSALDPSVLDPNIQLSGRLHRLMDEALKVAEGYFKVRAKGSLIDRCRKLEQAGWDRIFREDTRRLSSVALGLANRVAEEAELRMWHMRLVESFVAVTGYYVKENPSADRFAETTLLLRDMVAKIKGATVPRAQLGRQKAIVTVGQPIEVSSRLADYKVKRRGAIASLTEDLQTAMESLILHN